MTWNYRVIEFVDPSNEQPWLAIHEVYYDGQGNPESYTENPSAIVGDTPDEMQLAITRMQMAFDRPVLVEKDFHRPAETVRDEPCGQ